MAQTNITALTNHIQKFWSPMFMDELRANVLLPSLVSKEYQGEIKQQGDTVYVSQINAPAGELRTVGTDADSFQSEQLSTSRISVTANKRAVASFEFDDLSELQSQIDGNSSPIRQALVYSVGKKLSDYLYTLAIPSSSAPYHRRNSISDYNAAELATVRMLAAQAKWERSKGWYVLADPSYNADLMNAATLSSADYVQGDAPVVGGQIASKRFGFNILEDNGLSTDQALAFHPDFLVLCMQKAVQFKISDLHSQKKFGFVISADMIFGASLGIDGSKKCIFSTASASSTFPVTL